MRGTVSALLVAAPFVLLATSIAVADPGDLDTTFSGDGLRTTDFAGGTDGARAVVVQDDGKIVVGGRASASQDFALVRYTHRGRLDTSFGSEGKITTDFFGNDDSLEAVTQLTSGRIVAGGIAVDDAFFDEFALAGYTSGGILDPTWGEGGEVSANFEGLHGDLYHLIPTDDGGVVAVGEVYDDAGTVEDVALARYDENGDPVSSFGDGGVAVSDFGGHEAGWRGIVLGNGKIVVAGWGGPTGNDTLVARFTSNGDPDLAFADGGALIVDLGAGAGDFGAGVGKAGQGRVVVGSNVSGKVGMMRVLSDGSLDDTFGGDGIVVRTFANAIITDAMVTQNHRPLFAGTEFSTTNRLVAVRFTEEGRKDRSFGSRGVARSGVDRSQGHELALDDGDALMVVGLVSPEVGANDDFLTARFQA